MCGDNHFLSMELKNTRFWGETELLTSKSTDLLETGGIQSVEASSIVCRLSKKQESTETEALFYFPPAPEYIFLGSGEAAERQPFLNQAQKRRNLTAVQPS